MHIKRVLSGLLILGILSIGHVKCQDEDEDDIMIDDEADTPAAEEESQPELKIDRPEYRLPKAAGAVHFEEPFESIESFSKRWIKSSAKKDGADDEIAKYDGVWSLEEPSENPLEGDLALALKSRAKHHAISSMLKKPFEFKRKPFIVQYEVKFVNGQECGGAYIKLLTQEGKRDLSKFHDKTSYTIMFGPDKCGNDNKLHFIFRHQNPKTGEFEEKHAKKPSGSFDKVFNDKRSHLFTLIIQPDNTFEILVDQDLVNSGSLLEDMTPPVNPPEEITDPADKRPDDWDEREKIPDPDAEKPEDWDEDELELIPDESATMPDGWLEEEEELVPDKDADKPADWDDDMDGEWEPPMIGNPLCESAPGCGKWQAPQIKNPKYKGKWRAPLIDNPNYKGKWTPRKIPNPNYFVDKEPFKMSNIDAIGLELWSMSDDIFFDNFIIGDDKSVIDQWTADTWEVKHVQEELASSQSGRSVVDAVMDATNERPWLWAVFIVVVVLPIILIIVYCCMPGGSSKPANMEARKKTDAPTPDDPSEDDTTQSTEGTEAEKPAAKTAQKSKKASKADLEDKEEEEGDEGDAEDEEDAEADGDGDNPKSSARSSPRKRKPRRD